MPRINIIARGILELDEVPKFVKKNQYFRFCEIEALRSVDISVPKTDANRLLFGFADTPSEYGEFARRKLPCEMVVGLDVIKGYIVVEECSDRFSLVFYERSVELFRKLQRKLSDFPCVFPSVPWSDTYPPVNANQNPLPVDVVAYENGYPSATGWQLVPSVDLRLYIADLLTQAGFAFTEDFYEDYRIIAGSLKGGDVESVKLEQTAVDNLVVNYNTAIDVVNINLEWASWYFFGYHGGGTVAAQGFRALKDITITFPASMPAGCYLVQWSSDMSKYRELGGISADGTYGTPLGGATVQISKGTIFFFANKRWYDGIYWGYQDNYNYLGITTSVERDGDLQLGESWDVNVNAPDMTLAELLKSAALLDGMELLVDYVGDTPTVTMEHGLIGNVNYHRKLTDVVSVKAVTRNVNVWGADTRKAVVCFDSEDYVTVGVEKDYTIDNDTIEAEPRHEIKFSEGLEGSQGVLVRDVEFDGGTARFTASKWSVGRVDANSKTLQRVGPPVMEGYDQLAEFSTCVRFETLMSLADFNRLTPYETFFHEGCGYVWTEADWSDGVASLVCQKILGNIGVEPVPLPYDKEIEYLQATGAGQYIDTGIIPTAGEVVEVTFKMNSTSAIFFGARDSSSVNMILRADGGNFRCILGAGPLAVLSASDNSKHTIKIYTASGTATIDDGAAVSVGSFLTLHNSLYVCLGNANGSTTGSFRGNIYNVKIGSRMNLKPVRVGSVGYMYDTVSGTIFGNAGGGDFVLGPDI